MQFVPGTLSMLIPRGLRTEAYTNRDTASQLADNA